MPKNEMEQGGPAPKQEIQAPVNINESLNTNVSINIQANPQVTNVQPQVYVADEQRRKAHAEKRKNQLLNELVGKSKNDYLPKIRQKLKAEINEYNEGRRKYLGSVTGEEDYAREYNNAYKEIKSADKRKKAINNRKSRLYKKARNQEAVQAAENQAEESRLEFDQLAMKKHLLGKPADVPEDVMEERKQVMEAFSAFTQNKDGKNNYEFWGKHLTTYLGLDSDLRYLEGDQRKDLQEKRRREVMDTISSEIITEDLSEINLCSDTEIAANAEKFEQLKSKVDAYVFLMNGEPLYFQSRGKEFQDKVESKLQRIKLICEYYDIRKQIMRNPYYTTHYNSELTMQAGTVDQNAEPEKYQLSKMLLKSYYLGLAISQNHLGGTANMQEMADFDHEQSQEIRKEVKKEAEDIANSAMSISLSLEFMEKKENTNLKAGFRESTKKRWAHSSTTKEYGRHLKEVAGQVKREAQGKATEKDKILGMNRFETIPEEKPGEDKD